MCADCVPKTDEQASDLSVEEAMVFLNAWVRESRLPSEPKPN